MMTGFSDYDEYGKDHIFARRIRDINSFQLTVNFPMISDWESSNIRMKLQDRLHDDTIALLRAAHFYSENQLKMSKQADHFSIEYDDDVHDFMISCYQDRLVLRKRGVRMSAFHKWYFSASPNFRVLVTSLLDLMQELLERKMEPTSVGYFFGFILYDFVRDGETDPIKNYEVMKKLVTKIPGPSGSIDDDGAVEIGRTDYQVNCWDAKVAGGMRQLSYSVEAPANRDYSGLWFKFAYGTGTYADPNTGERKWNKPGDLLEESDLAYEFMWKRAASGFMNSMLAGLRFETTTTYIP